MLSTCSLRWETDSCSPRDLWDCNSLSLANQPWLEWEVAWPPSTRKPTTSDNRSGLGNSPFCPVFLSFWCVPHCQKMSCIVFYLHFASTTGARNTLNILSPFWRPARHVPTLRSNLWLIDSYHLLLGTDYPTVATGPHWLGKWRHKGGSTSGCYRQSMRPPRSRPCIWPVCSPGKCHPGHWCIAHPDQGLG